MAFTSRRIYFLCFLIAYRLRLANICTCIFNKVFLFCFVLFILFYFISFFLSTVLLRNYSEMSADNVAMNSVLF